MRHRVRAGLVAAVVTTSLAVTAPGFADNIGNEGCTPGYWKNHTDNWEEYSPSDQLGELYDIPTSLGPYSSLTLEGALRLRGGRGASGGAQILLRAATAAALNAAHEGLGYPYRRFEDPLSIIAMVNAALASGDRAQMLELAAMLDEANNLGCPLN